MNVFTCNAYLSIPGENNLYEFNLLPYRQYQFTETEWRPRKIDMEGGVALDPAGDERVWCNHYKVVSSDGKDYCWVPDIYAPREGKLRTEEQQDRRKWQENVLVDQPKDHKKVYKQLTGIDLNKTRRTSYNGYELGEYAKKHRLDKNGKIYGKTTDK